MIPTAPGRLSEKPIFGADRMPKPGGITKYSLSGGPLVPPSSFDPAFAVSPPCGRSFGRALLAGRSPAGLCLGGSCRVAGSAVRPGSLLRSDAISPGWAGSGRCIVSALCGFRPVVDPCGGSCLGLMGDGWMHGALAASSPLPPLPYPLSRHCGPTRAKATAGRGIAAGALRAVQRPCLWRCGPIYGRPIGPDLPSPPPFLSPAMRPIRSRCGCWRSRPGFPV